MKSTVQMWEETWKGQDEKRYNNLEKYTALSIALKELIKEEIKDKGLTMIELGCGRGNYMIKFSEWFGCRVSGIDYSKTGCTEAIENLKSRGITGDIRCEDILNTSFREEFDIVLSSGLIEHFKDPKRIIDKHIKLTKKGGLTIILVPNYGEKSKYRKAIRMYGKEEWLSETHNLKTVEIGELKRTLKRKNMEWKTGYFGPVNLFTAMTPKRKEARWIAHGVNQAIGYATIGLESEKWSPYIAAIGRKN